jgi:hypothetical protein
MTILYFLVAIIADFGKYQEFMWFPTANLFKELIESLIEFPRVDQPVLPPLVKASPVETERHPLKQNVTRWNKNIYSLKMEHNIFFLHFSFIICLV